MILFWLKMTMEIQNWGVFLRYFSANQTWNIAYIWRFRAGKVISPWFFLANKPCLISGGYFPGDSADFCSNFVKSLVWKERFLQLPEFLPLPSLCVIHCNPPLIIPYKPPEPGYRFLGRFYKVPTFLGVAKFFICGGLIIRGISWYYLYICVTCNQS